jgi:hypothetical protein
VYNGETVSWKWTIVDGIEPRINLAEGRRANYALLSCQFRRCCYITLDFKKEHHKTDLVLIRFPLKIKPKLLRK